MPFRCPVPLLLAASTMLAAGCEKGIGDTPPKKTILPASAVEVQRRPHFSYPVTYYGRIEPARRAALSFELSGRLEQVLVDEGRFIEEGATIAKLDTSALEAEKNVLLTQRRTESALLDRLRRGERAEVIAAAEAEVKRLDVELQRALAEKNRAERVYASKAISRSDYDQAVYSHQAAVFSLERAQQRLEELESGTRTEDVDAQASRVAAIDAQLNQLDVTFEKSVLVAPFNGICVRRLQDEGVTVSPGLTVVEINEANRMEARFSIPPANLNLISPRESLEVNGKRYPINEARAISQVDETTRTVDVVIPLQIGPGDRVLPGQSCTLAIVKRVEEACIELPVSALVASVRGLWSCYRLEPNPGEDGTYTVVKVDVSIVHTDGVRAFVSGSLPDRALVIPDGVHKFVPGMQARIVGEVP